MQQTNQDAQKFSQGRINILMQATKNMTKKQMKQNQIEDLFHEDVLAKKKESMTEFSEMFEQSLQDRDYKVGDIVKGKIVEVQTDYVLVDINYKSEGLIPINEFRFVEGKLSVQPGDEVEVFIDKIENENFPRLIHEWCENNYRTVVNYLLLLTTVREFSASIFRGVGCDHLYKISFQILGNPENLFAVETAFLIGQRAELKVLPFWRRPYWISYFRFGRRVIPLVSLDSLTPKTGPLEFCFYLV